MPDTDEGERDRGCIFFERGFGQKRYKVDKKIQARCEGYSFWRQKKEQAGERGNRLGEKD